MRSSRRKPASLRIEFRRCTSSRTSPSSTSSGVRRGVQGHQVATLFYHREPGGVRHLHLEVLRRHLHLAPFDHHRHRLAGGVVPGQLGGVGALQGPRHGVEPGAEEGPQEPEVGLDAIAQELRGVVDHVQALDVQLLQDLIGEPSQSRPLGLALHPHQERREGLADPDARLVGARGASQPDHLAHQGHRLAAARGSIRPASDRRPVGSGARRTGACGSTRRTRFWYIASARKGMIGASSLLRRGQHLPERQVGCRACRRPPRSSRTAGGCGGGTSWRGRRRTPRGAARRPPGRSRRSAGCTRPPGRCSCAENPAVERRALPPARRCGGERDRSRPGGRSCRRRRRCSTGSAGCRLTSSARP